MSDRPANTVERRFSNCPPVNSSDSILSTNIVESVIEDVPASRRGWEVGYIYLYIRKCRSALKAVPSIPQFQIFGTECLMDW